MEKCKLNMQTTENTVRSLAHDSYINLLQHWVGNWRQWFVDPVHGGFFERLDHNAEPLDMGYKRLVIQCRQVYVNSYAYLLTGEPAALAAAQNGYNFINNYYYTTQGFYFSVKPDGKPCDTTRDLYAHAFIILCLAKYYQATQDTKALELSKATLNFIHTTFKAPWGGFYEALDDNLQPLPKIRRQNPHMHLFEACLAMYATSQDVDYLVTADYVLTLFSEYFFDHKLAVLREFFTEDLNPDPETGHIIEPGHHFEWVALIDKRLALQPAHPQAAMLKKCMVALFDWAVNHGIDHKLGGIFNEINCDQTVINTGKRIWIITECIRAHCVMAKYQHTNKNSPAITELFNILLRNYVQADGKWVEICNQDLTPQFNAMPGTTTYHIFINLIDAYSMLQPQAQELPVL